MNKGFTLVETVLLLAVVSVILTLAFPDIITTFRFQSAYDETARMANIREGLISYAKEHKKFPDTATWHEELSAYTTLSEDDVLCDSWNRRRVYRKATIDQGGASGDVGVDDRYAMISQSFPVEYAIVYGYGENGCLGENNCTPSDACSAGVPSSALPAADFDVTPMTDFEISQYESIEARLGDYLVKATTLPLQLKAYGETTLRLKRITESLSNYATRAYNTAVEENDPAKLGGASSFRDYNYNPLSGASGDNTSNYFTDVVGDSNAFFAGVGFQGGNANHSLRRTYMIQLMRMLGLPDSYCCSALRVYDDGGVMKEEPFFYYSNPKPRNACGAARPTRGNIMQPARVRLEADACG